MHLLGGVEAPRDVPRGMFRVWGREEGKLRAAVLGLAARLINFRHWDSTWRGGERLLAGGGGGGARSGLYPPVSPLGPQEAHRAPPAGAPSRQPLQPVGGDRRAGGARRP